MESSGKRNLVSARATRDQIARTFDALERHELTLTTLLETIPPHMRNVHVFDLLCRSPKLDEHGADKVLRDAKVWPTTRLSMLTARDKQAILAHLPPRVKALQ